MIQPGTRLVVADNSGARVVECITVLGGAGRSNGVIGDIISASVKLAAPHGNVKKKAVVKAVIVRQRQNTTRIDGSAIKFDENAAVIIDKDGNPIGTRIFGPIPREIRERGYRRIISLAEEVL